jgi:hypothetical protein
LKHQTVALGILVAVILSALPAQGTVLIYLNTKELTERSQVVVQGKVVKQQVLSVHGRLWTDTHVRVRSSIKGYLSPGQILVLRQPGGETPTEGLRVDGVAAFKLAEEVLVFARPVGTTFVPVGMALGKYTIYTDQNQLQRVRRDVGGLAFAAFDAHGQLSVNHGQGSSDLPLAYLVSLIRSHLKHTGGGR